LTVVLRVAQMVVTKAATRAVCSVVTMVAMKVGKKAALMAALTVEMKAADWVDLLAVPMAAWMVV